MGIMAGEDLQAFLHATHSPRAFLHVVRRVTRHFWDLLRFRRGMQLVNGQALVGRLLKSADRLGARLLVSTQARELVVEASGRVVGAKLEGPQGPFTVHARRGTVLATGGYPHDEERRRQTFPAAASGGENWPLPPAECTGDGIRMAERVGAHFDASMAAAGAWCPVSMAPLPGGRTGRFPHIIDRGKPGVIGVLADGHRFVNEAHGYHDYVQAMYDHVPVGQEPVSWLVCDRTAQRRYPLGFAKPFPIPARPYLRSGYLTKARSLRELATRCGIDPDGLEATVEAYNRQARLGEDPLYGRGSTTFNRTSGDADVRPNPCVAPIERPPFFAVKVYPGCFGTFAGLKVDANARVLDADGNLIPGLWAVGTDMASVMGGHYPSGGINLGPAMTFGFLAGEALASSLDHQPERHSPVVGANETSVTR
jgi:succinate dehydrogenase/fumarate reductase flavoprotein subunit